MTFYLLRFSKVRLSKEAMVFHLFKTRHVRQIQPFSLQRQHALLANEFAAVSFAGWIAVFGAQVLGAFINDGLPLWICRRYYKGIWHPEIRLYVLGLSAIVAPVGLAICGTALKMHYHYMVFALGYFIVGISVLLAVPVATNYVAESFSHLGTECTLVMTFYRLAWGVAIPFFCEPVD